jgi:hypothetical protein
MKNNIVDHGKANAVPGSADTKMRLKWPALLLALLSVAVGAGGCADPYYYGGGPYYGGGRYYGGGGVSYTGGRYYGDPYYGGRVYGPGYGPGSVTVAIGDRPYYTRGPGYWSRGAYYVWRPGRWSWVRGQRVWIRGRYLVRR